MTKVMTKVMTREKERDTAAMESGCRVRGTETSEKCDRRIMHIVPVELGESGETGYIAYCPYVKGYIGGGMTASEALIDAEAALLRFREKGSGELRVAGSEREWLRNLRERVGLTRSAMSRRIGLSDLEYAQLECGVMEELDLELAALIAFQVERASDGGAVWCNELMAILNDEIMWRDAHAEFLKKCKNRSRAPMQRHSLRDRKGGEELGRKKGD